MDFTREPIIETVITPKEGHKLVVRSSKSTGQEEYFVEAVEVVSFGSSFFFRSIERPKAFLVPVSDYEVLEVRETRMVLKNVGIERAIKIGGGREGKAPKETQRDRTELVTESITESEPQMAGASAEPATEVRSDGKVDKKRDRRRHARRRRGRDEEAVSSEELSEEEKEASARTENETEREAGTQSLHIPSIPFSTMLPPPTTLISESIARYKDNALFKGAFFVKEEDARKEEGHLLSDEPLGGELHHQMHHDDLLDSLQNVSLEPSDYGTFEPIEEGELYQQEASNIFSGEADAAQTFLHENYEEEVEIPPLPSSEPKGHQDES